MLGFRFAAGTTNTVPASMDKIVRCTLAMLILRLLSQDAEVIVSNSFRRIDLHQTGKPNSELSGPRCKKRTQH